MTIKMRLSKRAKTIANRAVKRGRFTWAESEFLHMVNSFAQQMSISIYYRRKQS